MPTMAIGSRGELSRSDFVPNRGMFANVEYTGRKYEYATRKVASAPYQGVSMK